MYLNGNGSSSFLKMKHLVIRTGRWTGNDGKVHSGNHPSPKRVGAVDAEMFIHYWYSPEDFKKQATWEYEMMEESILEHGMKEPICIRPQFDTGDYEMWDGSHRMVCVKHIFKEFGDLCFKLFYINVYIYL